jgi:hypothetical protein
MVDQGRSWLDYREWIPIELDAGLMCDDWIGDQCDRYGVLLFVKPTYEVIAINESAKGFTSSICSLCTSENGCEWDPNRKIKLIDPITRPWLEVRLVSSLLPVTDVVRY